MNKEFIPYDEALELKELGFNEKCSSFYYKDLGTIYQTQCGWDVSNDDAYYDGEKILCSAPLYQQSFRWFREKYGLDYEITYGGKKGEYHVFIKGYIYGNNGNNPSIFSYEEAELECLKKLIEIIK